jgi:hypothetical protein
MTRRECIDEACRIASLVWRLTDQEASRPNDCFCNPVFPNNFQNTGDALRYVKQAVVGQLKRDGFDEGVIERTRQEIWDECEVKNG